MFVIDIAKYFSVLPQGKYHTDSPNCAEALFIMIQDALDYEDKVELRFSDRHIIRVGSSFLHHLASMIVTWDYQDIVIVTSDDDWLICRYNIYLTYWEDFGK